jgi:LacI family transcriptional regulator
MGAVSTRRPTLVDVAALAQCSPSAVSLVVSGKSRGRISPEVATRVESAVAELGYRPHRAARSLATGRSGTIAVVVPDAANPYYAALMSGLAAELTAEQSITLAVVGREEPLAATISRAVDGDPDGLVVCSPANSAALRGAPLSEFTVVLDAPGVRSSAAHVDVDVAAAGRLASTHLRAHGHRRIGWLGPDRRSATFLRRRDAAAESGRLDIADVSAIDPDAAAERFRVVWPQWSARGVTAVICADDLLAYGVLLAAAELGITVPHDLALIGMGNLWNSQITSPALTSVDLHAFQLGQAAARALARWQTSGTKPARRQLPVELVVRAST